MLLAKVREDCRQKTIVACAGVLFFKGTWCNVPADREDEARRNPFLEVDTPMPLLADEPPAPPPADPGTGANPTDAAPAPEVPQEPEPEPIQERKALTRGRNRKAKEA